MDRRAVDQRPVGKDGDLTAVQQVACLRLLGSSVRQLDGEKDSPCPPTVYLPTGEEPEDHFSEPSAADVRAALAQR